jgi:hypothetical protein
MKTRLIIFLCFFIIFFAFNYKKYKFFLEFRNNLGNLLLKNDKEIKKQKAYSILLLIGTLFALYTLRNDTGMILITIALLISSYPGIKILKFITLHYGLYENGIIHPTVCGLWNKINIISIKDNILIIKDRNKKEISININNDIAKYINKNV